MAVSSTRSQKIALDKYEYSLGSAVARPSKFSLLGNQQSIGSGLPWDHEWKEATAAKSGSV